MPLGAFLSGGVDSSTVVALMSNNQSNSVATCSIGMGVAEFDETEYAHQVANRYDTDHHHQVIGENDYTLVDQLAEIYG